MDKRDILAGLEDVPWPDLDCAGDPEEIPALLRAVISGSEEADIALADLACSLYHQGSVYPASERAAPFLARIAAAGSRTQDVLEVLGSIAESNDERGLSRPGAARAAVAAQSGLLAPLLADPHPEVRAAAAWALTQAQAPALVPLLGERWNIEAHPLVRATILKAISVLSPDLAARLASGVLAESLPADGGLLLIAAAACFAAGQPWTDRLHAAATAWMTDGEVLPRFWGGDHDPFEDLALVLAARGEPAAAVRLIAAGLTYSAPGSSSSPAHPAPKPAFRASPGPGRVRQRSAWSALELVRTYRSPAEALVLPLSVAAADEDAGFSAISLLRELHSAAVAVGPAAAYQPAAGLPVVDQPVVTGRLAAIADVHGEDRRADEALACLIELGDPRAARLLARDLRHRPYALNAAASAARSQLPPSPSSSPFPALAPSPTALPCYPALLDAVRGYLRAPELLAQRVRDNVPGDLLALVHSWGPDAVPAIPEVFGLRAVYPLNVAITLAAVDPVHPDLLPLLRQTAVTGRRWERTSAASRLRDLTGEDGPLLAVLEDGLRQHGYELRSAAEDVAKLGPAGASLMPAVTTALHRAGEPRAGFPEQAARVQLALALVSITGDAALAIPVLAEALGQDRREEDGPLAATAADAAATLGVAAMPLVPAIVSLLDDSVHGPTAAHALLRIDPGHVGGVRLAKLAELLVAAVAEFSSHAQQLAVNVLAELGSARLPAGVVDQLRHLAGRDQRLRRYGFIAHIIRDDEQLRSGLCRILAQLP